MLRAGIAVSRSAAQSVVFDLPGCAYAGDSAEHVRAMLPVVVAEFGAWLATHGEPVPDHEVRFVEQIDADEAEGVEGEWIFEDDRLALDDGEVERSVRWMGYARADLLAAVDGVPDEILDWRPPATAMMRIDPWKPVPLTIREIVRDVVSAESYYRRGLSDGRVADEPADVAQEMALQRDRLVEMLRGLDGDARGRVYRPIRSWQNAPEVWTARKVVRRVISHERFHTAEIRQRMSWLLLGVPSVVRDG